MQGGKRDFLGGSRSDSKVARRVTGTTRADDGEGAPSPALSPLGEGTEPVDQCGWGSGVTLVGSVPYSFLTQPWPSKIRKHQVEEVQASSLGPRRLSLPSSLQMYLAHLAHTSIITIEPEVHGSPIPWAPVGSFGSCESCASDANFFVGGREQGWGTAALGVLSLRKEICPKGFGYVVHELREIGNLYWERG